MHQISRLTTTRNYARGALEPGRSRRFCVWCAALWGLLFLSWQAVAQEPVLGDYWAHDPSTMIKCGNRYYSYRTAQGIMAKYSTDLRNWTYGGQVFPGAPPAWTTNAVPGFTGLFWAPDIVFAGGRYLLYYSVSTWGSQVSAIGLATTTNLGTGPWTDQGVVIRSSAGDAYNCIDPSVLLDSNGTLWMAFGSYWSGIYLIQLDPATGKRISPTSPLTQLANNSTIEASGLFKRGSYYYLFVNWGSCCNGINSTYNIRVGRSTSVSGPYLDRNGVNLVNNGGTLFLETTGRYIGPGHAAICVDGSTNWFTYHYYDGNDGGTAKLGLRQLDWSTDGWPVFKVVEPPRITVQPQSRADLVGTTASFNVTATGTAPLNYQWRRNGTAVSGAISSSYALANVQMSDSGSQLSVVVTNAYGAATSQVVTLTVTWPSVKVAGALRRQVYLNLPGAAVSNLTSAAKYPDAPEVKDVVTAFESGYLPGDADADYGQRLSGWIVPPLTGDYVFYLASDDQAQLWLSTDEMPAHTRLIVEETSWNLSRNWLGQTIWTSWDPNLYLPGRSSAAISLQAGNHYYVEALHKESAGGDHVSVAWRLPGSAAPANGSAPIGGQDLAYEGSGMPPQITAQPQSRTNLAGTMATFSVTAAGTPPLSYQWCRNGTVVSGATASDYALVNVQMSDSGSQFSVVVSNLAGSATSTPPAVLTVRPSLPPALVTGSIQWLDAARLQFTFTGEPGARIAVEVSTNLVAWTPLTTLANPSGTNTFSEVVTNQPCRFYRLQQTW